MKNTTITSNWVQEEDKRHLRSEAEKALIGVKKDTNCVKMVKVGNGLWKEVKV